MLPTQTTSTPIAIEDVKDKELTKVLRKSFNEKYRDLFIDLTTLGITDDWLAITLEGTEDPQITMETTVLIPGPPFQQNADLEDLVRQQKSKDIRNNLLSRIKNLKEVSKKVFS